MVLVILLLFFLILLVSILYFLIERKITYKDLIGKHVVVTGGSSGIGKAAAMEAAKLGANVTIIGRDLEKLKCNLHDVIAQKTTSTQKIQYAVLDVTSNYNSIKQCLSKLEVDVGPIFMLVNCAGMCICGQFEDMKEEDIKYMVDLNYFGTAYPTKYVVPKMKERNEGIVVFVSSEAALIGIYGYSAYSAGKWAVRGLAESLNMELVGTNVSLTLAFPPDTDTPGFAKEELTKPKETKLISGSGGLQSPDDVGKKIIHDAMARKVYSVFGLSGQMMSLLFCGSIDSITQFIILSSVVALCHCVGVLAPAYGYGGLGYGGYGSYGGYPYSSYPLQPALATQQSNILRSPYNLGQVSTYSKAIDTPFSSVRKADIRVSNPGVAISPAYHGLASPLVSHFGVAAPVAKVATAGGLLGVAYSAAPAVSHMTYSNGLGLAYSW